jgi:hypothetical protein
MGEAPLHPRAAAGIHQLEPLLMFQPDQWQDRVVTLNDSIVPTSDQSAFFDILSQKIAGIG